MRRFSPILSTALPALLLAAPLSAQPNQPDTLPALRIVDSIVRRPSLPLRGVSRSAIYTGKKADAITVRALDANTALNSTRQTLGRVPGLMVWEQDAGGLQAGVSVRGLSPNRSWEFNTRQDGADIASDPFGYPEAYYQPPFEAVERIEVVRGAASLQYGPQFGGLLNYVLKRAPANRPFHLESSQFGGSFGTYSTYTAVGTHQETSRGSFSGYGFVNFRRGSGWRAHSDFTQGTGHAGVAWETRPSASGHRQRFSLGVTHMDYRLAQAGGLSEAQWAADAQQSRRARDWFSAPWTVPTFTWEGWLGSRTAITTTAFGTLGERNSVGVIVSPLTTDNGALPRRVDRDRYRNAGAEVRVVHGFTVNGRPAALASGVRVSRGLTWRDRGRGTDGDALSLAFVNDRTLALTFDTRNAAAFSEVAFEVFDGVSLAPGVRLESVGMRAGGSFSGATSTFLPSGARRNVSDRSHERVPLLGIGASVTRWQRTAGLELYGNVAEAWRPVLFSERFPNDLVAVDPTMRAARGITSDVGVRGRALGGRLTYDLSGFHLVYDDRIGTLNRAALGSDSLRFPAGLRTNVGRSLHRGLEMFAELDATSYLAGLVGREAPRPAAGGRTSIFTSAGRTVATYTRGPARGRQVEYSPDWVVRTGLTHRQLDTRGERWRGTVQASHVSDVYSDASNTARQADGLQGVIPAYAVWDASWSVRLPGTYGMQGDGLRLELHVNNLFDRRYFTRRASGYPGPGIIPAEPRTLMAGVRLETGTRR